MSKKFFTQLLLYSSVMVQCNFIIAENALENSSPKPLALSESLSMENGYPFSEIVDSIQISGIFPNNYIRTDCCDAIFWTAIDCLEDFEVKVQTFSSESKSKSIRDLRKSIYDSLNERFPGKVAITQTKDDGAKGVFDFCIEKQGGRKIFIRHIKLNEFFITITYNSQAIELNQKQDIIIKSFQVNSLINVSDCYPYEANAKSLEYLSHFNNDLAILVKFPCEFKESNQDVLGNSKRWTAETKFFTTSLYWGGSSYVGECDIQNFFSSVFNIFQNKGHQLISKSHGTEYPTGIPHRSGYIDFVFLNYEGKIEELRVLKINQHFLFLSTVRHCIDYPSPHEQFVESVNLTMPALAKSA